MNGYLSAADLLLARLRGRLTVPAANVRLAVSLDWAIKNALSPSVSVIFFDDVPHAGPAGTAKSGRAQVSDQYWLLLVSRRNVQDAGVAALSEAADLVQAVLGALQGHALSPDHGILRRQKCPYRKTDREGFVHFPLLFSTTIVITATLD